jgi:hypothetical protein
MKKILSKLGQLFRWLFPDPYKGMSPEEIQEHDDDMRTW